MKLGEVTHNKKRESHRGRAAGGRKQRLEWWSSQGATRNWARPREALLPVSSKNSACLHNTPASRAIRRTFMTLSPRPFCMWLQLLPRRDREVLVRSLLMTLSRSVLVHSCHKAVCLGPGETPHCHREHFSACGFMPISAPRVSTQFLRTIVLYVEGIPVK